MISSDIRLAYSYRKRRQFYGKQVKPNIIGVKVKVTETCTEREIDEMLSSNIIIELYEGDQ